MANELRVKSNFGSGVTTDNPLLVGGTVFNSAALSTFPAISATQHAIIVLDPTASAGAPEIAMITAHTGAATSATIVRGVEGSSARQHLSGTTWRHVNSYYDYLQIVANAAALPSTNIYQGMLAYQQDLDKYVGRSSAGVWQDLVAMGAWTSFTPSLTQSGAVTKTVTYGRYQRMGRLIIAQVALTCTGAGTAANAVIIGLPVTAVNGAAIEDIGTGHIFDQSTALAYKGHATYASTTTVQLRPSSTTTSGVLGTDTFTLALAALDEVGYSVMYEAAS